MGQYKYSKQKAKLNLQIFEAKGETELAETKKTSEFREREIRVRIATPWGGNMGMPKCSAIFSRGHGSKEKYNS